MPRLALLATLCAVCAAYWAGLSGPLIFDDFENLAPIVEWQKGKLGWTSVVFGNGSGAFGRPVSMASFILNIKLLGSDIWGLKVGNLALHLANGALVFWLFELLLRQGALTRNRPPHAKWLPWLGASIWLLHPLLVSTVLYVVQRMAMLSSMFVLLALLSYLYGRVALAEGRRAKATAFLAAVPACTVLAALSKENGILAPALCAAVELYAFQPAPGSRRPGASTAFVVTCLFLPALAAIGLTLIGYTAVVGGYTNRSFTLTERLLTQPRVLWDYVGSLLLPYGPRLGLYHDDYQISHSLLDPATTVIAVAAWAILIILAWLLRRAVPGFALGLAFFLVAHSLESSVFPLLMYFEHRNYLPAIGAIWALVSLAVFAASRLSPHMDNAQRIFRASAIGLLLALTVATAARAGVWQSKQTLILQGLHYHPDSRWVRMELIGEAMRQQPPRVDQARLHADHLLALSDPNTRRMAAFARLMVDCSAGDSAQATYLAAAFDGQIASIEADLLMTIERLSNGIIQQGCTNLSPLEMADRLTSMLNRSPLPASQRSMWRLRFKASELYSTAGMPEMALQQARRALSGGTADPQVAVAIASIYLQQGDSANAGLMLDAAARKLRQDDIAGRQIIASYRSAIMNQSQEPASESQ